MASLGGVELEHPLLNAAGTCRTVDDVARFAASAVSAVVVGSVTVHARPGNPGQTYHAGTSYSLNALGLPNGGMEYYRRHLPEIVELVGGAGKPLVVSVAGFDVDEYATMAHETALAGVDLVEVNLACPNVWDAGRQKRIACFDAVHTAAICTAVGRTLADAARRTGRNPRFGVKLSPFSDPAALAGLAAALADLVGPADPAEPAERSGPAGPAWVTAVNTFPNAVAFDRAGRPAVDPVYAGLGGAALKPVGLGQVRQLRALLPDAVDVVGVGGVASGRDVVDYLRAGACAVGLATAFWDRGGDPRVFGDVLTAYADLQPPTRV
jgi:dihydroorotate dehydrogenase (fumarate)